MSVISWEYTAGRLLKQCAKLSCNIAANCLVGLASHVFCFLLLVIRILGYLECRIVPLTIRTLNIALSMMLNHILELSREVLMWLVFASKKLHIAPSVSRSDIPVTGLISCKYQLNLGRKEGLLSAR